MFGILVLCAAIIGPNDDENPVSFVYFLLSVEIWHSKLYRFIALSL